MTRWSSAWLAWLLAVSACSNAELAGDAASTGTGGESDPQTGAEAEAATEAEDESESDEGNVGLDAGGQPLAGCDPWVQDCPVGEKCSWERVDAIDQTRCVALDPEPELAGQPCTVFGDPHSGYDDCELGAMCMHVDPNNVGVCMSLCAGSPAEPSCPVEPAVCQVCPDCPSLCKPVCNPLADDCPVGFACTPEAGSLSCQPNESLGTGMLGDPCEYAFQCAAGHACVDATKLSSCEGTGCCSPFCALSQPECPNPLICIPWFPDADALLPELGVCSSG